ncbi:general transcription factor 3C polypeptide 5 [Pelomyxa schiedti]|nr:general transcription factor 3C polypeptide 5 [Pelomyxa schiedti]
MQPTGGTGRGAAHRSSGGGGRAQPDNDNLQHPALDAGEEEEEEAPPPWLEQHLASLSASGIDPTQLGLDLNFPQRHGHQPQQQQQHRQQQQQQQPYQQQPRGVGVGVGVGVGPDYAHLDPVVNLFAQYPNGFDHNAFTFLLDSPPTDTNVGTSSAGTSTPTATSTSTSAYASTTTRRCSSTSSPVINTCSASASASSSSLYPPSGGTIGTVRKGLGSALPGTSNTNASSLSLPSAGIPVNISPHLPPVSTATSSSTPLSSATPASSSALPATGGATMAVDKRGVDRSEVNNMGESDQTVDGSAFGFGFGFDFGFSFGVSGGSEGNRARSIGSSGSPDDPMHGDQTPAPFLPVPSQKFTCVEFPGAITGDVQNALASFGGATAVSSALRCHHAGKYDNMLQFAPRGGLFARPAYAHRKVACNMLLQVKHTKPRLNSSPTSSSIPEEADERKVASAEIIGVIDSVFQFSGLFDFQFIVQESAMDEESLVADTLLNIPPPVFSRVDRPIPYRFRPNPLWKAEKSPSGSTEAMSFKLKVSQKRRALTLLPFNAPILMQAPLETFPSLRPGDSAIMEPLTALFKARFVWSQGCLHEALSKTILVPLKTLRRLLPYVAFRFQGGPWRTALVAYGYDPRKDPASRIHQVGELRIREALPKKSTVMEQYFPRQRRQLSVSLEDLSQGDLPDLSKEVDHDTFRLRSKPYQQTFTYMFSDIDNVNMQRLLAEVPPLGQCTAKYGWLPLIACKALFEIARKMAIGLARGCPQNEVSNYGKEEADAVLEQLRNKKPDDLLAETSASKPAFPHLSVYAAVAAATPMMLPPVSDKNLLSAESLEALQKMSTVATSSTASTATSTSTTTSTSAAPNTDTGATFGPVHQQTTKLDANSIFENLRVPSPEQLQQMLQSMVDGDAYVPLDSGDEANNDTEDEEDA